MTEARLLLRQEGSGKWLHFLAPLELLEARSPKEVIPLLEEVEQRVEGEGLYAAGFLSFQAAPAFDPSLRVRPGGELPLAWFGLFKPPEILDDLEILPQGKGAAGNWRPGISPAGYRQALAAIRRRIAAGETYQVNYTFPLEGSFGGSPAAWFRRLVDFQPPPLAALVEGGRFALCSASPELFFRRDGEAVTCRPMKGTVGRGRTLEEDEARAAWLRNSEKNRAENLMIVDMVRNDLGRVARPGTVRTPALFSTERYPTLWQLTSTVTAETEASQVDLLAALFPSASITGAPKARTMEIIAALETAPREIYTGSIGYLAPGRRAQFSVAIRTAVIHAAGGRAVYGVGGGITADSSPRDEYAECLLKARMLESPPEPFRLLETLLWQPGSGFFLLERHLARMEASARYWNFSWDRSRMLDKLSRRTAGLPPHPHKIRLLLAADGEEDIQAGRLEDPAPGPPLRVALAPSPVDSRSPWLFHKTTRREVYDRARAAFPNADEVLLWNERGEVTEATTSNLIAVIGGSRITPALTCGLLPGTLREELLERGGLREGIVTREDLEGDTELFLINSVRGERKAFLSR